jgi:hypothetical protein
MWFSTIVSTILSFVLLVVPINGVAFASIRHPTVSLNQNVSKNDVFTRNFQASHVAQWQLPV